MKNGLPIKIDLPDDFLEEEIRCEYTISSKMKAVWAVELDLLNELDKVCKKNNIKYMLCAGSVLGAIRHGGFIPWDDDLDIMLKREDYKKLCECAVKEFTGPYFFQTEYTDPGTIRGHAQLRNSDTTAILKGEYEEKYSFNQGIFIDIFPLDFIPSDINERKCFIDKAFSMRKKYKRIANLTYRYRQSKTFTINNIFKTLLHPFAISIISMFRIKNWEYIKFEQYCQKYNGNDCNQLGIVCLCNNNERFIWDKKDVEQVKLVDFEMIKVPVPIGYINTLKKTYGDWKKMVIGNSEHGLVIFDPYLPYKQYINK